MKLNTMNFVPYYDDYTEYDITEDDINKIQLVAVCHPNFIAKTEFIEKLSEQFGSTESILLVTNGYIENENSIIVIDEEALKKAFIISHLISMKKEKNNEEKNKNE